MSCTPQAGDRVRHRHWASDQWVDVKYVGQRYLIGPNQNGAEQAYLLNTDWIKVELRPELPELPEVWLPISRLPSGELHCSPVAFRSPVEAMHLSHNLVAVVKCIPDPDSVVWVDEVQS